jgi:hypothetical protein
VRSGLGRRLCLGPAATDLVKDALLLRINADPRRLLVRHRCLAATTRWRLALQPRLPEQIDAEVVEERGELLLLRLLSCFSYASERLGHTSPALCPVCALLACVPLGPRPWLRRLRRRLPGIVRRFTATMAESDFPRSCIIGFGSSPSRCGPEQHALRAPSAGRGTSRFPYKKLLHMPRSVTTLGRPGAR